MLVEEENRIIRDLLENTRKTDRNALLLAFILACQTVAVAYFENRLSAKVDECRAKIGIVNYPD